MYACNTPEFFIDCWCVASYHRLGAKVNTSVFAKCWTLLFVRRLSSSFLFDGINMLSFSALDNGEPIRSHRHSLHPMGCMLQLEEVLRHERFDSTDLYTSPKQHYAFAVPVMQFSPQILVCSIKGDGEHASFTLSKIHDARYESTPYRLYKREDNGRLLIVTVAHPTYSASFHESIECVPSTGMRILPLDIRSMNDECVMKPIFLALGYARETMQDCVEGMLTTPIPLSALFCLPQHDDDTEAASSSLYAPPWLTCSQLVQLLVNITRVVDTMPPATTCSPSVQCIFIMNPDVIGASSNAYDKHALPCDPLVAGLSPLAFSECNVGEEPTTQQQPSGRSMRTSHIMRCIAIMALQLLTRQFSLESSLLVRRKLVDIFPTYPGIVSVVVELWRSAILMERGTYHDRMMISHASPSLRVFTRCVHISSDSFDKYPVGSTSYDYFTSVHDIPALVTIVACSGREWPGCHTLVLKSVLKLIETGNMDYAVLIRLLPLFVQDLHSCNAAPILFNSPEKSDDAATRCYTDSMSWCADNLKIICKVLTHTIYHGDLTRLRSAQQQLLDCGIGLHIGSDIIGTLLHFITIDQTFSPIPIATFRARLIAIIGIIVAMSFRFSTIRKRYLTPKSVRIFGKVLIDASKLRVITAGERDRLVAMMLVMTQFRRWIGDVVPSEYAKLDAFALKRIKADYDLLYKCFRSVDDNAFLRFVLPCWNKSFGEMLLFDLTHRLHNMLKVCIETYRSSSQSIIANDDAHPDAIRNADLVVDKMESILSWLVHLAWRSDDVVSASSYSSLYTGMFVASVLRQHCHFVVYDAASFCDQDDKIMESSSSPTTTPPESDHVSWNVYSPNTVHDAIVQSPFSSLVGVDAMETSPFIMCMSTPPPKRSQMIGCTSSHFKHIGRGMLKVSASVDDGCPSRQEVIGMTMVKCSKEHPSAELFHYDNSKESSYNAVSSRHLYKTPSLITSESTGTNAMMSVRIIDGGETNNMVIGFIWQHTKDFTALDGDEIIGQTPNSFGLCMRTGRVSFLDDRGVQVNFPYVPPFGSDSQCMIGIVNNQIYAIVDDIMFPVIEQLILPSDCYIHGAIHFGCAGAYANVDFLAYEDNICNEDSSDGRTILPTVHPNGVALQLERIAKRTFAPCFHSHARARDDNRDCESYVKLDEIVNDDDRARLPDTINRLIDRVNMAFERCTVAECGGACKIMSYIHTSIHGIVRDNQPF